MPVSVYAQGKWRRATSNQYRAFSQRVPNVPITTGRWTVAGTNGDWYIYSDTERYRIKNESVARARRPAKRARELPGGQPQPRPQPPFEDRTVTMAAPGKAQGLARGSDANAWSAQKAAVFFELYRQQFPEKRVDDYVQAVTTYVTTPSITQSPTFDFTLVAKFGEIAFADSGLTRQGFWVGQERFANSDGPSYKTTRAMAMTLFNEAYATLARP